MTSLLLVGGLTIDRFADGSTAPGGSVLHAGLAASAEGAELRILTTAGGEPEAADGIARLRSLGETRVQHAAATTAYRHDEVDGSRVLVYEAAGGRIDSNAGPVPAAEVALLAPIADELPIPAIRALATGAGARLTVLLVQGWLRHLRLGAPVRPMHLDEVAAATWAGLAAAHAIIVSTEDFTSPTDDPFAQAALLRERLGPTPLIVLTMATDGHLLDDPAADRVVASVPRNVVEGVPMVGAGDTFGAAFAIHLAAGADPGSAAAAATDRVIAVLEARR